jgi:hypothetical protein
MTRLPAQVNCSFDQSHLEIRNADRTRSLALPSAASPDIPASIYIIGTGLLIWDAWSLLGLGEIQPAFTQEDVSPVAHVHHQAVGLPASCDGKYSKFADFCYRGLICSWSGQPCNTRKNSSPKFQLRLNQLEYCIRVASNWTKEILQAGKSPTKY